MNRDEIPLKTRAIYLKQHNNYLNDEVTFKRFLNMTKDPSYFHLSKSDFEGKKILDAGCGNTGYFQVAMNELKVEHMTCLDLGDEWIKPLSSFLEKKGITNIDYVSGSTDELPFPDESFDMVFSNGVLMHLVDVNQVNKALKELARVTKRGGYFYVVLGCPRGFIEEEFFPALRNYYANNNSFREVIDNLNPEIVKNFFLTINNGIKEHTGESFNTEKLDELFDIDFCTTVQNIIQAPTRLIKELDEEYIMNKFDELGFEDIKRCKRYVHRNNIRKYLAPLHFDNSSLYSQLLYGDGNLEYIARKK